MAELSQPAPTAQITEDPALVKTRCVGSPAWFACFSMMQGACVRLRSAVQRGLHLRRAAGKCLCKQGLPVNLTRRLPYSLHPLCAATARLWAS